MEAETDVLRDASGLAQVSHGEEQASPADDSVLLGSLNHKEFVQHFQDALAELIVGDQFLQGLHTRITLEEVQSQICLEHGQAMTINLKRGDDQIIPIVVLQNGTVQDLKMAIRHNFQLKLSREDSGNRPISWRYVWRRYWLYFNGQKLTDDQKKLKDYDIRSQDVVTFIKCLND